jgi:hypothetical protein
MKIVVGCDSRTPTPELIAVTVVPDTMPAAATSMPTAIPVVSVKARLLAPIGALELIVAATTSSGVPCTPTTQRGRLAVS